MRILFDSILDAKRTSKALQRGSLLKLSKVREELAKSSGYKDWHELERATKLNNFSNENLSVTDMSKIVLSLSIKLKLNAGKVLNDLCISGFASKSFQDHGKLKWIRAFCFRHQEIPYIGPLQRGDIRYVEELGSFLMIKSEKFSKPVTGITPKSCSAICADFELGGVAPLVDELAFIPTRTYLPYGYYEPQDGCKLIFSRDYLPLWYVYSDGRPVKRLTPRETVGRQDFKYFWGPKPIDWNNRDWDSDIFDLLDEFDIIGMPKLVEVLPTIFNSLDIRNLQAAAKKHFA